MIALRRSLPLPSRRPPPPALEDWPSEPWTAPIERIAAEIIETAEVEAD